MKYRKNAGERKARPRDRKPDTAKLTPAGRLIWLRTRRPAATCNLIAALAGLGDGGLRHG